MPGPPQSPPAVCVLPTLAALTALVLAACGPAEVEAATPPRNVLLVSLDTLRPDHLGTYGYDRDTSPALDAIADGFTVFDDAHTVAPWTAPSLISLMTSLYPDAHEVKGSPDPGLLSDGVVTLAEALQAAGYRTGAFTEGGYAKADFGLGQGFDEYPSNPGDQHGFTSNRRYPSRLAENVDRALRWMGEVRGEPFFCFFQTYEPHSPYQAPLEFVHRYRPNYDEEGEHERLATAVGRWNDSREISDEELVLFQRHLLHCDLRGLPVIDEAKELREESRRRGVSLFHRDIGSTPAMIDWYTDLYDAEIAFLDRELARLWKFLDETGLARDTIVVIVSDHGEGLGEHSEIGHGRNLFEELTRIVYMVRVPGTDHVRRSSAPVSLVDVMPSVLELTGTPAEGLAMQGESFVRHLRGEGGGGAARPLFSHATLKKEHPQHAVRLDGWRLIVDDLSGETELYDLDADPLETTNLSAQEPERVARMMELLAERQRADFEHSARINVGRAEAGLSEEAMFELEALGYIGDEDEEE